MERKAFKNSVYGLINQIVITIVNFVLRRVIIKNIGVEWLGVNATLGSMLNAFALSELGINSVISFYLYRSIQNHDEKAINKSINIYRIIYIYIGIIFLTLSVLGTFGIPFFIKGIELDYHIYIIYGLLVLNSVSAYFLAYRNILLEADQNKYIETRVSLIFTVGFSIVQIFAIRIYHSYIIFLILGVAKTILVYLYLYFKCSAVYPFLRHESVQKEEIWTAVREMKNAFGIKIASYVYCSTDNLVISHFLSTIIVGVYSNYSTLFENILLLARGVLYPLHATIGNLVAANKKTIYAYFIYMRIAYIVAGGLSIPAIVLIQDFIGKMYGKEHILKVMIPILLVIIGVLEMCDIPNSSFILSSGKFKDENIICMTGALINIVSSVYLIGKIGIPGVLLGTIISSFCMMIFRTFVVFSKCFHNFQCLIKHIFYSFKFIVLMVLSSGVSYTVYNRIKIDLYWLKFLLGGFLSVFIFCILFMAFWFSDEYFKDMVTLTKGIFIKKK